MATTRDAGLLRAGESRGAVALAWTTRVSPTAIETAGLGNARLVAWPPQASIVTDPLLATVQCKWGVQSLPVQVATRPETRRTAGALGTTVRISRPGAGERRVPAIDQSMVYVVSGWPFASVNATSMSTASPTSTRTLVPSAPDAVRAIGPTTRNGAG